MAVPANTIQTMTRIGNREDLADIIYNIDPVETPFVTAIGRTTAENVYHEWQTDVLVAANPANAQIQGDDAGNENRPATTRVGNYTQIMWKVVGTSSTQRATKAAGRKDEHAYQLAKASKELKRDMEARFTGNFAAVVPLAGTAGQSAGAQAWLRTNVSRGATGANPTLSGGTSGFPNAAATNGTQRTSTEALLKTVLNSIWTNGGESRLGIMGGTQKQNAAAFPGIAQQRRDTGNKRATIVAGADVYVSDFGEVQFVPDRFIGIPPSTAGSNREILLIDPEYWSIATLDPLQREPLGKTGLSDKDLIYGEFTLRCNNERASGIVADLS